MLLALVSGRGPVKWPRLAGSCRIFVVALRGRPHSELSYLLRCEGGEHMHHARDDAGPASLVTRAESGAIVAVEVLVELKVVAPQRIGLEFLGPAIHRPV